MKTRVFREMYDFCRADDTYWGCLKASDESRITGAKARKYYYGDIRRGQCRVETFIYHQSIWQFERLLRGARQDYYIHADPPVCRRVNLRNNMFPGQTTYIMIHVRRQGVQIEIEHPLHGGWVYFTTRPHRPFTREGITAKAKSYINSHILLVPGRYRDLQLENMISKEQFPTRYRLYKMRLYDQTEAEHRGMVGRYKHRNDLTYGEARDMLAASGILFNLNYDEFERDEITEQLVRLCSRT